MFKNKKLRPREKLIKDLNDLTEDVNDYTKNKLDYVDPIAEDECEDVSIEGTRMGLAREARNTVTTLWRAGLIHPQIAREIAEATLKTRISDHIEKINRNYEEVYEKKLKKARSDLLKADFINVEVKYPNGQTMSFNSVQNIDADDRAIYFKNFVIQVPAEATISYDTHIKTTI